MEAPHARHTRPASATGTGGAGRRASGDRAGGRRLRVARPPLRAAGAGHTASPCLLRQARTHAELTGPSTVGKGHRSQKGPADIGGALLLAHGDVTLPVQRALSRPEALGTTSHPVQPSDVSDATARPRSRWDGRGSMAFSRIVFGRPCGLSLTRGTGNWLGDPAGAPGRRAGAWQRRLRCGEGRSAGPGRRARCATDAPRARMPGRPVRCACGRSRRRRSGPLRRGGGGDGRASSSSPPARRTGRDGGRRHVAPRATCSCTAQQLVHVRKLRPGCRPRQWVTGADRLSPGGVPLRCQWVPVTQYLTLSRILFPVGGDVGGYRRLDRAQDPRRRRSRLGAVECPVADVLGPVVVGVGA